MNQAISGKLPDGIQKYQSQLKYSLLVLIGFSIPWGGPLLLKRGEGWEFQGLGTVLVFLLVWYTLIFIMARSGEPPWWIAAVGIAPLAGFSLYGLVVHSAGYTQEGMDFWGLLITWQSPAKEAFLSSISPPFLLGIPLTLAAFLIGHALYRHYDAPPESGLSHWQMIALLVIVYLSFRFGQYLESLYNPALQP